MDGTQLYLCITCLLLWNVVCVCCVDAYVRIYACVKIQVCSATSNQLSGEDRDTATVDSIITLWLTCLFYKLTHTHACTMAAMARSLSHTSAVVHWESHCELLGSHCASG